MSNNTAAGNDADGFTVGSKSQVNANKALENFDTGIRVQCPGTVANNQSSGNSQDYALLGAGCITANNR